VTEEPSRSPENPTIETSRSNGHRLQAKGLTCVRERRLLFSHLELELESGEVLLVEGFNGAGKTSLLRILCGLSEPREGTVLWKGEDIRRCRWRFHQDLLYIGHNAGIKLELTPMENLRFLRSMGGHRADDEVLEETLERVGLEGFEDIPVRMLSAGQRRRVALARLWLSAAPLWILDEPLTAIDRRGVSNLATRILEHANDGGMVVLTTHQPLDLAPLEVRRLALG